MSTLGLNDIISTPGLAAWRCGSGVCRIQTTEPRIAARLSRLKQMRQVGESVVGGYLRLFETTQRPKRLKRLLARCVTCSSSPAGDKPQAAGVSLPDGQGQDSGQYVADAPRSKSAPKRAHLATGRTPH